MTSHEGFEWVRQGLCMPYPYFAIYVIVGLMSLGYYVRDLEIKPATSSDPWPGILAFTVGWPVVMIAVLGWYIHAWWHAPPLPPLPPEQPLKGP